MSENKDEEKTSLINIEDLTGLSKPLEKLIECISNGCGKLFNSLFIKKMADSNAYEIKTLKDALGDSESEITINRNGTIITLKNQREKVVLDHVLDKESKKLENTSKVIQNTANILKDKESVSDEPVDKDWLTRFFRITEDISNEEMQNLWSKILADEIEKPNSYSLRTLQVLKNISSKEAKLFTKFVNLCFKFSFIYCDKLIFIENKSKNDILFFVYSLTTIGQEISTIIERKFELSYAKVFSDYFKSRDNISAYITDLNMSDLTYNPSNLIEI